MKHLLVIAFGFVASFEAMAIEEPSYRVILSEAPYEHRRYAGFVVAETFVPGNFDTASRTGFRRVADYIFGNNVAKTGNSEKIAMTAPVTVEEKNDGWQLHFVMPAGKGLESLPKPNRPEVSLRQVGEHDVAAVRFSGWTTEAAIEEQTGRLRIWMKGRGLTEAGTPKVARYDDPFTLPWRRRNEILIPIATER